MAALLNLDEDFKERERRFRHSLAAASSGGDWASGLLCV